jgi:hypothetical protein
VNPVRLGAIVGLTFGTANLVVTWISPLLDDSPLTLLLFYGPMFLVWSLAAARATRRSGRVSSGVITGVIVALATFALFYVTILLRVNLFLADLIDRADWQNMLLRFRASGGDSLRLFVNLDYIKGAPLKLGVSGAIGALMGVIGGSVARLTYRSTKHAASC